MRISLNWLREYVDCDLGPHDLAAALTMAGLEVEGIEHLGERYANMVVAEITDIRPHPNADKLQLATVDCGEELLDIVCGAPNIAVGQRVPLALVGAVLPSGMKIRKAKIRGQESIGMLCSLKELGLEDDHSGIWILDPEAPIGRPLAAYLELDDYALELSITPNRPDCLSIVGVAREAAAIMGQPLRLPDPYASGLTRSETRSGLWSSGTVTVEVQDRDLCPCYLGRLVRGITVKESPVWMQNRLRAVGLRPINNIVDISNFVLYELGHPLHTFDYNSLREGRIVVRRARQGEIILTLDGEERSLSTDMLVIADAERPVAIAGIMGGAETGVEAHSRDVLIESAYFQPKSVRLTARALNLHTDASHRFERGADPEILPLALDRVVQLILELSGGEAEPSAAGADYRDRTPKTISFSIPKMRVLLGAEIEEDVVETALTRYEFEVQRDGDTWSVKVPSFRPDVAGEADLAEEVGRFYGYDRLPEAYARVCTAGKLQQPLQETVLKVERLFQGMGLSESINLIFVDEVESKRLGVGPELEISNPLRPEQSHLRASLAPALLRAVDTNWRRGVRDVGLYEIGRLYCAPIGGSKEPVREINMAGGAMLGETQPTFWDRQPTEYDIYQVKGLMEQICKTFNLEAEIRQEGEVNYLHPQAQLSLVAGGHSVMRGGKIHPDVAEHWELPLSVYLFEIDLDLLHRLENAHRWVQPLPKFPAVARDLSVVLSEETAHEGAERVIRKAAGGLLQSVQLHEIYRGDKIESGCKAMLYTLVFQSPERTLEDKEVNSLQERIISALTKELGAVIRR